MNNPIVSIVIPVLNEANNIYDLFERLKAVLIQTKASYEIVIVDDGSTDNTIAKLIELQEVYPQLLVIELSRNFGKEAALTAGLQHASGDAVITIDADLQDPPELILEMLEKWKEGNEVVTAVRTDRKTDTFSKRFTAKAFYWLMDQIADIKFQPNAGDFRLLDRKAVNALLSLPERTRFNKGLFAWIGFKNCFVFHARDARNAGASQFNFRKLLALAIDGITSFSNVPLRIFGVIGLSVALLSFIYGSYILLRTLLFGVDLPGYASIFVVVTFFGGLNLIGIGLLGEYIGRVFLETKQRPIYLVRTIYQKKQADNYEPSQNTI